MWPILCVLLMFQFNKEETPSVTLTVSLLFLFFLNFFSTDSLSKNPAHQVVKTAQGQHITLSDTIVALIIVILAQTSPMETTTQIED